MNILRKAGCSGVIVMSLDDSNPVILKFSRKIDVKVQYDSEPNETGDNRSMDISPSNSEQNLHVGLSDVGKIDDNDDVDCLQEECTLLSNNDGMRIQDSNSIDISKKGNESFLLPSVLKGLGENKVEGTELAVFKSENEANGADDQIRAESGSSRSSSEMAKDSVTGLKCVHCERVFENKDTFLQHHTVANTKISCRGCGKICHSKTQLIVHKHYNHHPLKKPQLGTRIRCLLCYNLCRSADLFSHVREMHTKERFYVCCVCNTDFDSKLALRAHLRSHKGLSVEDSEDKVTKSAGSSGAVRDGQDMNQAISEIADQRQLWTGTWKCEYCDRVFKSNGDFVNHIRPSEIVDVCEKCHFKGPSIASVSIHYYHKHIKETNEDKWKDKPFGKIYCHFCGENCSFPELLDHVMNEHTNEVPYQCCLCKAPMQSVRSWQQHAKDHEEMQNRKHDFKSALVANLSGFDYNNANKLQCGLCNEHIVNEQDFIHHHRNKSENHLCDICQTTCYSNAEFIIHKYTGCKFSSFHLVNDEKMCEEDNSSNDGESRSTKCPRCDDVVQHQDLLFHVMQTHTMEFAFKCCVCHSFFSQEDRYIDHCNFHLGKKPYGRGMCLCRLCNLRFESRNLLHTHQNLHKIICTYCSEVFSTTFFLNTHLQNNHAEEMLSCELCGKKYHTLANFADHKRHHHYRKQHQCPICGIMVCLLEQHLKTHSLSEETPFSCHICGAQFRKKRSLKDHMCRHETTNSHSCDICKKAFKSRSRLSNHVRTHLKERKKYKCVICGKICTQKHNLLTHMRIHQTAKAFNCKFCDKAFNYNQSLQKHISTKHGEKQNVDRS